MTYRPITPKEIPSVAAIQARAFRREVAPLAERYREPGRSDWQDLRLLENAVGEPVAALTIFERPMSLNRGELAAGLVASVAVPPEQRRRGYAGRLMTGLLEELHARQTPISLLFPFSAAYYGRLGYGLVNLNWFLDVPPRHLPDYAERLDVRRATPEDHDAACASLTAALAAAPLYLHRSDWF